jgi:NAD(P)H-nitrite reductase large subunit
MKDEEIIICRCEDITLKEIKDAIHKGYKDIESLRKYLQLSAGPCQGKTCIPLTEKILAQELKKRIDEIAMPTTRPPETPVPFGIFSKAKK